MNRRTKETQSNAGINSALQGGGRRSQLHIYRNGKKILVLAGKAQPKVIREDKLNELITQ